MTQLLDAIHTASLHPARMPGVDNRLGSIAIGKRASLIALNSALFVQHIWIHGQALPL